MSGFDLVAFGDVAFQRPISRSAVGRVASWKERLSAESPALFFGNLEIPLTDGGTPSDKPVAFRGAPAGAADLAQMGFDVLSLANNHALDYGEAGLRDTMAALSENRVAHVGAGIGEESLSPHFVTIAGTKVAFVALCATVPRGYAAGDGRLGVAPLRAHQAVYVDGALFDEQPGTAPYIQSWPHEQDLQRAEELVRSARAQGADLVVAALHWGVPPMWLAPYQGFLAEYQRPMAERLVAAGVDVIFGHHPHVPHPWEWVDGKPVFWSLGNFIFQPYRVEHPQDGPTAPNLLSVKRPPETEEGLAVRIRVSEKAISGIEVVTFVLDEGGEPCPPSPQRHAAIMERLRSEDERGGGVPVEWRGLE
ncbi:MAG TPA: CapA family protein [Trueperaceae bacterium]